MDPLFVVLWLVSLCSTKLVMAALGMVKPLSPGINCQCKQEQDTDFTHHVFQQ